MAEPQPPASRRIPGKVLGLAGAILVIVLGGLFLARPASAATTAPVQPAAHSQPVAHSAPAVPAAPDASMATGVCAVPGIGDIGGLLGLCTGGSSGVVGDLNNICTPSVPEPEQATTGVDSLIATPGGQTGGKTLYDNYGIAGQYWAATGLQCSDMTSLIGNNVAGMVFDMAKSLDRATITIYQTAAGNGILTWLQSAVNTLITALGKAIYYPFLAPVVLLGAVWLAWQGLIRKRATRTIEGTIWMVLACAAAVWLIGRPGDFTGIGTTVSNGVTQVLNTAFSDLPAPAASNCLPVTSTDPQSVTASYAFTSGNGLVDENANELWSVLVCKPWLDGELGTTQWAPPNSVGATTNVVNQFGRQLLWSQAIAANEHPTQTLITAKQNTYTGIAQKLQANYPAVYPLFQGKQWTTRLEIGFEALFAALAAGLLVLLIALTLILLKLGFLLLLVAGPFFLIVGVHPGFGRVIAIRWFEMLVGVLMKQVAIALVLSILLYCYSLIMGTTDQALPWGLKIMMIALVTVAVFIYRKPFQHLFSSVGYGVIGSTERAEYSWREASTGFRRASANAAGAAVPTVGAYRAARWARRNPAAAAATGGAAGAAAAAAATAGGGGDDATGTGTGGGPGVGNVRVPSSGAQAADGHAAPRLRPDGAPPANGDHADATAGGGGGVGGGGGPANGRSKQWPEAAEAPAGRPRRCRCPRAAGPLRPARRRAGPAAQRPGVARSAAGPLRHPGHPGHQATAMATAPQAPPSGARPSRRSGGTLRAVPGPRPAPRAGTGGSPEAARYVRTNRERHRRRRKGLRRCRSGCGRDAGTSSGAAPWNCPAGSSVCCSSS